MNHPLHFIAVDLGAESGRAMLAVFDGRAFRLAEAHRFSNIPVRVLGSLYWDPLRLFGEIQQGLAAGAAQARQAGGAIAGIGLDTWGVDFALLDSNGQLLANPFHYRDRRTEGMMERAFERVPKVEIFERSGIQFMPINSLYMLLSLAGAPALNAAATFLMMPDLFNYWLSGVKACEFTDATTTQLYDQRAGDWARSVIEALGLPGHIFLPVTPPGTVLGPLWPALADEFGLAGAPVIASASHDTASAVAAAPARARDSAYISSGTWSIVGVETEAPVITPQSLAYNFTNEGGAAGAVRFSKNVMGLWLIQECRRVWAQAGDELAYADLAGLAEAASPFGSLVDPDDERFLRPADMPARLQAFCRETRQPIPEGRAAILRCVFESLALKYGVVLERLEAMLGRRLEVIHVVGGGSQNRFLCQLTADAAGRPVVAGPAEATALGNVLVQAMALGHFASLAEAREAVHRSVELTTYEPRPSDRWAEARARFERLLVT